MLKAFIKCLGFLGVVLTFGSATLAEEVKTEGDSTYDKAVFEKGVEAYKNEDYAKAFNYFEIAATKQNLPTAMRNLGTFYRLGLGVKVDDKKAFEWYKKSAEAGLGRGMYNLALMYLEGKGVDKSETEAIAWLIKAAAQDFPDDVDDDNDAKDQLAKMGIDVQTNSDYLELRKKYEARRAKVNKPTDSEVKINLLPQEDESKYSKFNGRFKVGEENKKSSTINQAGELNLNQSRAHVESYHSEKAAIAGFFELSKLYNLEDISYEIKNEDTPKGNFYRLYLVGDMPKIKLLCENMKAKGEYCALK
jgi:hypothetical protein